MFPLHCSPADCGTRITHAHAEPVVARDVVTARTKTSLLALARVRTTKSPAALVAWPAWRNASPACQKLTWHSWRPSGRRCPDLHTTPTSTLRRR